VEWFANLTSVVDDPAGWARDREAEGYDGVACSDHFWMSRRGTTQPLMSVQDQRAPVRGCAGFR
jgi:hypothetical protein